MTKAIAVLERATHVDPEDEVEWYHLAQAERTAVMTERNPAMRDEITP